MLVTLALAIAASALPLLASAAPDEPGQALFGTKCQGCHTIGGGRLAGPDLQGVTDRRDKDWLIGFITEPDQVIGRGDAIAKQLVQEYGIPMPNMGLSRQDAEAVLDYVRERSGAAGAGAPPPASAAAPAAVGDAFQGRALFTGETPLANGGPACISCHTVAGVGALGGGALAKDLTATYPTLGEQGIGAVLKSAPFPVMREIYPSHPLTDDEIAHLVAFLQEASSQQQPVSPLVFPLVGLVATVLALGAVHFIWLGRLGGVRRPLLKGGSK